MNLLSAVYGYEQNRYTGNACAAPAAISPDTTVAVNTNSPCSSVLGHPAQGRIWLTVNGELKQEGNLNEMTWSVAEVIATLSNYVVLAAGDLIFDRVPRRGVRGNQEVMDSGLAGLPIRRSRRTG